MRLLDHPNVVALKHCFFSTTEKDELYLNLVLEYVPETVHRVIKHYNKMNQRMPMIYVKLYTYQVLVVLLSWCDFSSGFSIPSRCSSRIFICMLYYLPWCYTASSVLFLWYKHGKSRVHVCVEVSDTSYRSLMSTWYAFTFNSIILFGYCYLRILFVVPFHFCFSSRFLEHSRIFMVLLECATGTSNLKIYWYGFKYPHTVMPISY